MRTTQYLAAVALATSTLERIEALAENEEWQATLAGIAERFPNGVFGQDS